MLLFHAIYFIMFLLISYFIGWLSHDVAAENLYGHATDTQHPSPYRFDIDIIQGSFAIERR